MSPNSENLFNFSYKYTVYCTSPCMLSKYASSSYKTQVLTFYQIDLIMSLEEGLCTKRNIKNVYLISLLLTFFHLNWPILYSIVVFFLLIPLSIFFYDFAMFVRLTPVFTHSMKKFTFCAIVFYIYNYWRLYFLWISLWILGFLNTFYCVVHVFVNLDMKIWFILLWTILRIIIL